MPEPRNFSRSTDEEVADARRKQGPLDDDTAEVLTRVYVARRLNYQLGYYRVRMAEYEESSSNAFRAGAIIMSLTSLLAALGTADTIFAEEFRVLTAILPAMAAMVASFRQLYQWDRQAQLFKDSMLGLQRASLTLPDMDQLDRITAARIFPLLVSETEQVFEDEVNQWGQIALGDQEEEKEQEDSLVAFARDYGLDIYDENGNIDPSKLGLVKDILSVSRQRTQVNAPNLAVGYPEVGMGKSTDMRDTEDTTDAEVEHDEAEPTATASTTVSEEPEIDSTEPPTQTPKNPKTGRSGKSQSEDTENKDKEG